MIEVKDFIVVEFDLHARFIRKITLGEFNERRKEEFKKGQLTFYSVLMGVFETVKEADGFTSQFKNIDSLVDTVLKEDPFYK